MWQVANRGHGVEDTTRSVWPLSGDTLRGVHEPGDYIRTIRGVPVFQWNPVRGTDDVISAGLGNFGDLLGPLVVERMLWRRLPRQSVYSSHSKDPRLFSIGSVMHFAHAGDVIWGTGVNGKVVPSMSTSWPVVDVRAVRGPWTARLLTNAGIRVPHVFGDPVLLVGRLFPELGSLGRAQVHDTLVVPNFNDFPLFENTEHDVLAPTEPVATVLREIARSRFVVGSSLHAIGVADALGIPARFVVSEHEDPFKYRDYLAGTGRPTTRLAESVEHALTLGNHHPPDADLDALERAFPGDMWGFGADEDTTARPAFVPGAMQKEWLKRIADEGGASTAVSHFLDDLVPRVRDAALGGDAYLAGQVESAAAYLTDVAPEVTAQPLDDESRRLVAAIESRDITGIRQAARLRDSPPLAMLRATRVAARYLMIALVVHHVPRWSEAMHVQLVLTGRSTGAVVRQPMTVFESQRAQWHVDFEVLVDRALLTDDGAWTLTIAVDGAEPVKLEVVSAPSEAFGLLALERGDLPQGATAAVISIDTDEQLSPPLQIESS